MNSGGLSSEALAASARRRLLVVIFGVAATLLAISMAVVFHAGRIAIETQTRMNTQLAVMGQLRELLSTVKDAETGQRGYLLTGEDSYLQPYNDAIPKLKSELAMLQKEVDAGEVTTSDEQEVSQLIDKKMAELARTVKLRTDSGLPAALAVVKQNTGKEFMDRLRAEIKTLLDDAQNRYDDAMRRAETVNTWRTFVFVGVTVANLAFLAWAFQSILKQDWLQSGHSQLNEKLAGEMTLKELSGTVLQFLATYMNAQAAALFVEEGGGFKRYATFAVPSSAALPEKFAPGEGLLGQAAKDKRTLSVARVPAEYFTLGSSLGKSVPRRLLIAPMIADGQVNAIVELGFFYSSYKTDIDLLDRISETVAIAVRSAKYRERLQTLLEETQRQSEELQAQSEELRVSNEELEEQSRALKESQARLEQQQAELEQSNSQLEEQTQILETQKDDLSRVKQDLEKQAEVVAQTSRYKSDFLANMSHELRTPLNSSLILAKLLADNTQGNLTAEQVKYANTIQSAGNDLLTLINDVLDLSKVEAGHMDVRAERFEIAHLVESMRGLFEPIAKGKGLILRMEIAPGTPSLLDSDRRRLEQVLKNLLSNAVKFTEKGEVAMTVSQPVLGKVSFAVRDTGIGIAKAQHDMVFEPFRQADSASNRKYGGTGLGLSISSKLVSLLGGTIHLSSEPGTGSVFTVTLPEVYGGLIAAEPSRLVTLPTKQTSDSPVARELRARLSDDRQILSGNSRAILVVEDDESFASILSDLAHELKFQVLLADSAEEALALATQIQPSAIILDVGLPDNSGMYVLERLKADARTRHIPVHVVSASDHSETALSMGAVGYMLKPVKREELVIAFRKLEFRLTQKLRRVLVVEDDRVQLDSLSRLLGSRDVETVGVTTAAECLENLKKNTFDCMVLDLSLPDASGFSLLETLSKEETYSFPPVIIYTGRDLSLDEEQRLRKYSKSIIIKGARSPERLLDEVTLFLHQVVSELPAEQQRLLEKARSREAGLEGRHILVAEDDVRNIFALTSLLEPKGVKIQIARNGKEAVQAVEDSLNKPDHRIDLVLMDIMMPEMNGLDAMRAIRTNPDAKKLPIIALTAKAMRDDQEQCLQAGANDYLAKPLDVEKLLSLIRVWMPR